MRMKHEGAVLRSDYECMTDQPTGRATNRCMTTFKGHMKKETENQL